MEYPSLKLSYNKRNRKEIYNIIMLLQKPINERNQIVGKAIQKFSIEFHKDGKIEFKYFVNMFISFFKKLIKSLNYIF